jgi:hypothetical protein
MFSNIFTQKNPIKYVCDNCDFNTCNKKDYTRHIKTKKHKINVSQCFSTENTQKNLSCNCGKTYKDNSGLWRHKKKCEFINENVQENIHFITADEPTDKQLIMMLIKDNNELKNMMMKVIENGTHNTTNSHNKSFNLQFFLNETCKDAMNIMDFVDSIKLQLSDLERIGEIGYVEGISNIIVKNLNALDVTQRPVHCTDKKREVLYVKDENKWEKEDDNKVKMHKVVKKVADKNVKLLPKFKEEYPDCSKSTSKYSDQYNKIIIESMGGSGDNDYEKEEKIIKKITKEVFIDKEPSQTL